MSNSDQPQLQRDVKDLLMILARSGGYTTAEVSDLVQYITGADRDAVDGMIAVLLLGDRIKFEDGVLTVGEPGGESPLIGLWIEMCARPGDFSSEIVVRQLLSSFGHDREFISGFITQMIRQGKIEIDNGEMKWEFSDR